MTPARTQTGRRSSFGLDSTVAHFSGAAAMLWLGLVMLGCERGGASTEGPGLFQPSSGAGQGERWTILCRRYSVGETADHAQIAAGMADMLKRVQGLRAGEVKVVGDSTGTSICYGSYRKVESKQTGRLVFPMELQRDIELIRSLSDGRSTPFFGARPELIGGRRGRGQGTWHISRARGPLTLLIARFYNTATFSERMEAAEQYTEQLRQQGFSAYYDHQDVRSFVYVGDFKSSDRSATPNGSWILGPRVQELIARNEAEFRYITDNGYILKRSGPGGEQLAEPSTLVPVPDVDEFGGRE